MSKFKVGQLVMLTKSESGSAREGTIGEILPRDETLMEGYEYTDFPAFPPPAPHKRWRTHTNNMIPINDPDADLGVNEMLDKPITNEEHV